MINTRNIIMLNVRSIITPNVRSILTPNDRSIITPARSIIIYYNNDHVRFRAELSRFRLNVRKSEDEKCDGSSENRLPDFLVEAKSIF